MDDLAGQLSSMADAIKSDTLTSKNAYLNAAYFSQHYRDYYHDFIDLYDFCNQLLAYSNSLEVKNIASNIQQTLLNAVINSDYNGGSVSGSKGLSVYFPLYNEYDSENYNSTNFAQDTFWDEMLLSLGL